MIGIYIGDQILVEKVTKQTEYQERKNGKKDKINDNFRIKTLKYGRKFIKFKQHYKPENLDFLNIKKIYFLFRIISSLKQKL